MTRSIGELLQDAYVRDVRAMLDRWEDEANDHYMNGSIRRAVYVDRWRAGVLNGFDGAFDVRLGQLTPRKENDE